MNSSLKAARRIFFEQAVERTHRVITRIATGLVDLIKHHNGVG
jgi:hypothetical protein